MGDPVLLQTKFLIPHRSPAHVARHSLVEQIYSAKNKQRIIIVAPAGYGKTSLLAEVAEQQPPALVWIQLDDGDNDPATFMAYLIEGLRRRVPDLSIKSSEEDSISPDRLLVMLINQLLDHSDTTLMVLLDDYHVIYSPIVHQLLTTLMDNLPPQMRMVISSRTIPALPLARWRANNQLLEIRSGHLRFSKKETHTWLSQQAMSVSDEVVSWLVEKTEGWGAGIQLALNLLNEDTVEDAIIGQVTGTQPYIFDYLMDEVFAQQSLDVQTFLLRSSVFTELNPQICVQVLEEPSSHDLLLELEKNGLFITRLDKRQQWYRYHQLFRDFLLSRFKEKYSDEYRVTQLKAGQYFARSGQSETAIQHFIMANDETNVVKMLIDFADGYLLQGRFDELQAYLSTLSSPTLLNFPNVMLLYGRVLRHTGQLGAAIEKLQNAIEISTDVSILCHCYIELAMIYQSQGQYQHAYEVAQEAVAFAKKLSEADYVYALMQLAGCSGFVKGMETGRQVAEEAYTVMQAKPEQFTQHDRAKLLHMLGQICWWHGDARMAIDYCQRALYLLGDMDTPLRARLLITLSTPTLYRKDYDTAVRLTEEAIRICHELHLKETLPAAYAAFGNVLTRIGDLEQAEAALETAIKQADSIGGARYSRVMAAGYLAQNLALQGRITEARFLVEQSLIPYENQPIVYDVYVCRSVLADLLLDTHKTADARQIYTTLISLGEVTQYRIPLAMAYFGLAYILMQEEQREKAIYYSQESLKLLEPAMMHQLYLDQRDRAVVICEALAHYDPQNTFIQDTYQMLSESYSATKLPLMSVARPDRIEVRTLGQFTVYRDGTEIETKSFASATARDLLAYFISVRDKSVDIDRAMDAIWPDGSATNSGFHTALYRVRVALRRNGEKEKYILSEIGDYRLDRTKFDVDVDRFDSLLKRIQRASKDQASELYERALELYRGDYMDNLDHDWALAERERLYRDYLNAMKGYSNLLLESQQYQQACIWLEDVLKHEPYDENVHVVYMQTLYKMGRQKEIARHYQRLQELLHDVFNSEPMAATQSVYQQLIK